jgi:adenylate kinase
MAVYIVLLGAPGAGKGTQGERLRRELGFARVATGDLFRDHIGRQTPLGVQVAPYLHEGKLVPDTLTIEMLRDRLQDDDCRKGVILDGFPRTIPQAEALEALLAEWDARVNLAPHIGVTREVLLERLSGRWLCRAHDHVYHVVFNPPQRPGVCDLDGSPLYQRADDTREVQERRIDVYLQHTRPLIDYYREQGALVSIDGMQSIDEVYAELRAAVERVLVTP